MQNGLTVLPPLICSIWLLPSIVCDRTQLGTPLGVWLRKPTQLNAAGQQSNDNRCGGVLSRNNYHSTDLVILRRS